MDRIIIGIHGLGSKPAPALLQKWWRLSMYEGLALIGHPRRGIPFELAYWADILHPVPRDPKVRDDKDSRFLEEPYRRSSRLSDPKPYAIRRKMLALLERQLNRLSLDENGSIIWKHLTDLILRKYFQDLDRYYGNPDSAQQEGTAIRERLAEKLRQYRDREIMLVAHSMGSIIAYDVLTLYVPDVNIGIFMTIGSPLGLSVVKKKIQLEQDRGNDERLPTPENICGSWYNFGDLEDKVAFDYKLSDDYCPNSRGVLPVDIQVVNDYAIGSNHNPHKAYGYLRTPELAKICFSFISAGQPLNAIRRQDRVFRAYEWWLKMWRNFYLTLEKYFHKGAYR